MKKVSYIPKREWSDVDIDEQEFQDHLLTQQQEVTTLNLCESERPNGKTE